MAGAAIRWTGLWLRALNAGVEALVGICDHTSVRPAPPLGQPPAAFMPVLADVVVPLDQANCPNPAQSAPPCVQLPEPEILPVPLQLLFVLLLLVATVFVGAATSSCC